MRPGALPEPLRPLLKLARNLWWTWNNNATAAFRDVDHARWDACDHSPLSLLRSVPWDRFSQLAVDPEFVGRLEQLERRFDEYMRGSPFAPGGAAGESPERSPEAAETWAARHLPHATADRPVAYCCAEYGIHESLRLYSGGLGMLAGDHLKSASDLGLPLVAIGLLYRQGYFHQRINPHGWQEEYYTDASFDELPLTLVRDAAGAPLVVEVPVRGRSVRVQTWRVEVGRLPLYLLDTDREDNESVDRWITAHLYGGDAGTRIVQEAVLGIGGVRVLRALGIEPCAFHLNEGHSAFLTLELVREAVAAGASFEEACESVRGQCLFTTHTPVPAGNDVFPADLMLDVLGHFLPALGTDIETVLALGRRHPSDLLEPFGMTPLAIRLSRSTNAVSRRHREVCARMWQPLWPDRSPADSPIRSITNGVHHPTWVAPLMRRIYDRHLGRDWALRIDDREMWQAIDEISDADLWRTHCLLRARLVSVARRRVELQLRRTSEGAREAADLPALLDPDALTIGFARRVAAYKRWHLFLHDADRLVRLFADRDRPVQLILAGKAHPRDNEGKHILQQVMQQRHTELRNRVVFLEDYDQFLARALVQGCDLWLNLPLPPLEASGTSGMKVVVNGGLNCSVLDGWWAEGASAENGWVVGRPYVLGTLAHATHAERDAADATSFLELLEREIVPLFYARDSSGVPAGWMKRVRASIKSLTAPFSAARMVKEYARLYFGDGVQKSV